MIQRFRLLGRRFVGSWRGRERSLVDFADAKKSDGELCISGNSLENGAEISGQLASPNSPAGEWLTS